jgi:hypothetical protein
MKEGRRVRDQLFYSGFVITRPKTEGDLPITKECPIDATYDLLAEPAPPTGTLVPVIGPPLSRCSAAFLSIKSCLNCSTLLLLK